MQPEATTLAYLAGVIDSDGYISIHRSCRAGKLYHAPIIGISGTRTQPHELAQSIWGGKIHCYVPKNPRHRPQYQWLRQGIAAPPIIEALLPYLRVKAEQASLALELAEDVQWGTGPDPFPWQHPGYDPTLRREEMRAEMILLLNQSKRPIKHAGRLLDGVEHNDLPEVRAHG